MIRRGDIPRFIMYLPPGWLAKVKEEKKSNWGKKASFKPSTRKTVVDIRCYKYDEFAALTKEQQDELQDHHNSNGNYKGISSSKAPGSARSSIGKGNYIARAQVYSILKENDTVNKKNAASKNEMVAAMNEELKGWISAYETQMVPGSTVGSAKQLKPLTISAVTNFAVDPNTTDDMEEKSAKSLIDKFLQMGTKSGGLMPATAPHW